MQTTVAKRTKPKNGTGKANTKNEEPIGVDSVLGFVRALWEATSDADQDVRDELRSQIRTELARLEKTVRTKIDLARTIRSEHEAQTAQPKLFVEEPVAPPPTRFEAPEVRVFVTDLAEHALNLLPKAARFSDLEDYRKFLVEKLSFNSVSTRKRNANYLVNRFFPGQYLHPDLTAFAAAAGSSRLGDVLFYLTARSERILQLVAENVVWPALPVGGVKRSKVRDFVKVHLSADDPAKRTTIAVAQCYAKFGIANVTKTKIAASIRMGDLASFAYLLHLEFPEAGMQTFGKLLDGPLHKWLLWDRQWMVEQLYVCRQAGLLTKVSEIDSMRQFTTRYSLAEAIPHIVNLIGKETP
jgi:DNA repair protein RadC